MYIIVLFVFLAVLGYFGIKAARYGALGITETAIFAILSAAFTGYLIYIIYELF
jgi:hypothetical protein